MEDILHSIDRQDDEHAELNLRPKIGKAGRITHRKRGRRYRERGDGRRRSAWWSERWREPCPGTATSLWSRRGYSAPKRTRRAAKCRATAGRPKPPPPSPHHLVVTTCCGVKARALRSRHSPWHHCHWNLRRWMLHKLINAPNRNVFKESTPKVDNVDRGSTYGNPKPSPSTPAVEFVKLSVQKS